MPIGHLTGAVITGGTALLALTAPRSRGPFGAPTYRIGLPVTELPFVFPYLLVGSTLLAFAILGSAHRRPTDADR